MCHSGSRASVRCLFLLCLALLPTPLAFAQVPADQMAEMILNSARKSFNEKNYPFAATRYREFLGKFGGHKEANAARYGLALALLESPEKNYNEARDLLQNLAAVKDVKDLGLIQYHLGLAIRGQGISELDIADAKPQEAPQRRATAQQRFAEAIPAFAAAQKTFDSEPPGLLPDAKELPAGLEWPARARCDQAELYLRLQKPKEAQAVVAGFVKDPVLIRSKYRDQGRYYVAFAAFLQKDNATAQQVLTTLAPFADPHFGIHARYLLARTHHLAEERAEATAHYEGVLADYAKAKALATQLVKQPEKFKNDPAEKVRLDNLVKNPPPDHVARATFYLGVLLYEANRIGEAQTRFADFVKLYPTSPLRNEAELRVGFCQVQTKAFADAVKTLSPLVEKDVRIADQVLFWLGKAQAGLADPANPPAYAQAITTAMTTYRQALDRTQKLIAQQDPDAPQRRGEILLEIADTAQTIGLRKDSVAIYTQLLGEKILPEREEEILQRLTTALHLAGDFGESDRQCQKFQEKFPRSTLLPAVLFCYAENNYFRSLGLDKTPPSAERTKELTKLYDETVKRLETLLEKYPEYPRINVARYTLGLTHYRQGQLEKAQKTLETIPAPDRNGDLAIVPYIIADCLLRQVPAGIPDDALAAGKMEEQLKTSGQLLEAFVGNPIGPQTADALLKLGIVHQRLAGLLAQPAEKTKLLNSAKAVYQRLLGKEFKDHPVLPQAILENAKCVAQTGDPGNAIKQLQQFTNDPLKNTNVAPMALIHLATLLRAQNKAADAVTVLANSRQWHEGNLAKDPERAAWLPLLRYHHGVALRESGKLPEARAVFELVVKQVPDRLEGIEAALRLGQCLKEEGLQKLDAYRKFLASGKKLDDATRKLLEDGYKDLRASAQYLETQLGQIKGGDIGPDARARMLYEAAWAMRLLSEPELQSARTAVALESMKKLSPPANNFPPLDVAIDKVPIQPAEKKARELYQTLVKGYGDVALATDARFELAELLSQRKEYDAADALLKDVLDKEPSPELTDKVRIRLGEVQAGKGNLKGALAQFDAITQNPKSAMLGQALYRSGEVHFANKEYPEAVKRLIPFRDNPNFQNVPAVSDRALLRLGHAFAELKNWEESRKSHERLVNAFPNSAWIDEGRYGMAFALQQLKNYDGAIGQYAAVVSRTASDLGARSQLQIGLCKLEQKKYGEAVTALLIVPTTYGYSELSANALLEAGRAHAEAKQLDQAAKLLERVVREYPNTAWAQAATERLKTLRPDDKK